MKLRILPALVLLGLSSSVHAGPFNDKLAICLVEKTSQADKTTLMRWIFGAMSRHPDVADLTQVSQAQADTMNKEVADLFVALLADRCATETAAAVKYEGSSVIASSFEVLGKVAMQGLMTDAAVNEYISGLDKNIEPGKLEAVLQGAE
ncbi:MAG TPA: hypothetical protein PLG89_00340 [Arenimonas sp.]|nr:hypothetical protein [Arenimonas sp.]